MAEAQKISRQDKAVDGSNGAKAAGSKIDTIYQALSQAILARELLPGMKLSEESIGALFSVSRTVVRAALNRLHSESLVEFRQNRGAFVASTTPEEAREVFEARTTIEREVFTRLAGSITDEQILLLEQHLAREHAVSRSGDHAAAILLSGDFHMVAVDMVQNRVMAGFLRSLISRTSLILAQHSSHQDTDCSLDEHAAIIEALRARDPEASGSAIVEHLRHVFGLANIGRNKRTKRTLSEILEPFV